MSDISDVTSSHAGPATSRRLVGTARRRAGRLVRVVRQRTSRDQRAVPRAPDDPRLFFRPGTGGWYVSHDGRWYEPSSDDDIDTLLALLPLEIIDEAILSTVSSAGGFVRVTDDGAGPALEFLTSFGEEIRRVANLIPGLSSAVVEWHSGAHDDDWVETVATLRLDGVRRCWLDVYLPENHELGDKQLAVQTPAGRRTTVDIHHLARGETTRVELYRSRTAARGITLVLQTSEPEPADDDRPLGFVVVGLEALS